MRDALSRAMRGGRERRLALGLVPAPPPPTPGHGKMPSTFVCRIERDRSKVLADPRSTDPLNQELSEEINAHPIVVITATRSLFGLGPFSSPKHVFGKKNLTRKPRSNYSL
jgi:hypothetical protein